MRPLDGIRVLDLTRLLPGPFGSLVLADLGATVDKIEDPGSGDYLRHMPPAAGGTSAAFGALNRGKRSAVIDLKAPAGRDALLKLACSYDVLFEQFRPGVLDRLGLSHARLLEANPSLIICALTGYGQTGPLAKKAGHDLNYLARAGVLGAQGPAAGAPAVPGVQLADISGGLWCVVAILAALEQRRKTQRGTVLDIAMTDGVLGFATTSMTGALAGQPERRGEAPLTGGIAPYNTYLSKDGAAVTIAALEPKFLMSFAMAVGLELGMEALAPGPHQEQLKARFAEVFASKTRDEWKRFSEQHDCCVEVVLGLDELRDDPHLNARGLFFDVRTTDGGAPQLRTPVTPRDCSFRPAPSSGEHTRQILIDAGFSGDEVQALFATGAARE